MFIRFVVPVRHADSHRPTGVFHAADELRRRDILADEECARLNGLLRWFNRRLRVPHRLSRSRRAHACGKAICWFKPDARLHVARVRELAALLERHGVTTDLIRTARPGYVVYEDDYQVAAVPFRDTGA